LCYVLGFLLRYASDVSARQELEGLAPFAKGVLLALAALQGEEALLSHLDDDGHRQGCVRAWRELGALDAQTRAAVLDAWRKEALHAAPAEIERLHPSWMADLASREPFLRDRGTLSHDARRDVERVAHALLEPLWSAPAGPQAGRLCDLDCDDLLDELTRLGARAIGWSLSGSAPQVLAKVMAAFGEPWAGLLREASAHKVSEAQRAVARACASTKLPSPGHARTDRLLHVGLAWLRAELGRAEPASLRCLAGRLPAPLGRWLLEW
jgi:hypothetical protein